MLPMIVRVALAAAARFQTGDCRCGSFVELGAYDGIENSNTYFLERCARWDGLLIEGQPKNFELLRHSGREAQMINSAVCNAGQHIVNMTTEGGTVAGTPGLAGAAFEAKWRKARGKEVVSVPCAPLHAVFKRGGIELATFFSLDVEGSELLMLNTTEVGRPLPFLVLLVEASHYTAGKNARVRTFLRNRGMVQIHMGRHRAGYENELYVMPEIKALMNTSSDLDTCIATQNQASGPPACRVRMPT